MSIFQQVRGAIDGTYLLARAPEAEQAPFRNRKGSISQNALASCTLDMYFFYILPGWKGSAADGRVLENAVVQDFPQLPGRLYLADAGYGLKSGILTPYRGVRYRLREQVRSHLQPKTKEEFFNLRHSQLRNVIERIFGVIKKRFLILDNTPEYSFNVQVRLIPVLCALHNFIHCRTNGEED